jgi:hypothetical protein
MYRLVHAMLLLPINGTSIFDHSKDRILSKDIKFVTNLRRGQPINLNE